MIVIWSHFGEIQDGQLDVLMKIKTYDKGWFEDIGFGSESKKLVTR